MPTLCMNSKSPGIAAALARTSYSGHVPSIPRLYMINAHFSLPPTIIWPDPCARFTLRLLLECSIDSMQIHYHTYPANQ